MPLVVDAYNVLHTPGVLPAELAHIELSGLIGLLTNSRYRHDQTFIICDGGPRKAGLQRPTGQITIQFAGPGREADDVIEDRIAQTDQPRQLTVVSSDRRLRRAARTRRCKVVDSPKFLQTLLNDFTKPRPGQLTRPHQLTAEQVQQWIIEFDLEHTPWLEIPAAHPKQHQIDSQNHDLGATQSDSQPKPPPRPAPGSGRNARSGARLIHGLNGDVLAEAAAMLDAYQAETPPLASPPSPPEQAQPPAATPPSQPPPTSDVPAAKSPPGRDDEVDDARMRKMFPGVRPLRKDCSR